MFGSVFAVAKALPTGVVAPRTPARRIVRTRPRTLETIVPAAITALERRTDGLDASALIGW